MKATTPQSAWRRHFIYRKETWKTTWKLKLSVLFVVIAVMAWTWDFWKVHIAQSLVCTERAEHSDALLMENFDPDYLVVEKTEALREAGIAPRVFIPVVKGADSDSPNAMSIGFLEVMAGLAGLSKYTVIPIPQVEPISLNAAKEIRDFLLAEHLHSVVVVAPAYRSRRSAMVYNSVLTPAGITVGCVPVLGSKTPQNWSNTWHGVQEISEQFIKLQYYRFYVLR